MCLMALSDAVLGNLATIYVAVIIAIKAYGLITGKSFSAGFVVVVSITAVGVLLAVTLAWDVSRRAAEAVSRYNRVGVEEDLSLNHRHHHDGGGGSSCKGGICWHGVAVRSPASQVRFRLPQHIPYGAF
ncbi:PREDICTED: uncharacterized protein LOC104751463 [Camelina sativa]|uniref:Uncharacterized protein LOC104751462 isoform X1 n=1 Tax=Camelina sativa TaxID=90675 RepID=A0ABM0WIW7_CAMSA|nr:PREDICTED: uncharacterized protein LOC104751462 isoform X1 [Camelina sativa]XP_010471712.1 PREDICTED: uncharacterized protein LOC104751462 isoform X2 [Camelina sativa]XP_010471713.1 PREDICTED: uncharacterized protein LOC104751463 [Camelina sativa]